MEDKLLADNFRILKALYDHVPYEIHVWRVTHDDQGRIDGWKLMDANPTALKVWSKSLGEVTGKTNEQLFPDSDSTRLFLPVIQKIFETGRPFEWEETFPDTGQVLRMISIPLKDIFISCGMDVTAYRDIEAELTTKAGQLNESRRRLKITTEAAQTGLWEYDLNSKVLRWDNSMYTIYGVDPSKETLPYEDWWNAVHEDDIERASQELSDAIDSGGAFKSRFRIKRADTGEIRHISAQAVIEFDENQDPVRMIGVNIDETDRRNAQEKIDRLAYYDTLTDLPNRSLIGDRLDQAIARSARMGRRGAVIFIDLDNFKHVNDSAGHALGDELLSSLARKLEQVVGDDDTVGRFGGDEYVIIMNNLPHDPMAAAKAAESLAETVAETIRAPIELSTGAYGVSGSIGISVFMGQDITGDDALRQADLAMYRAKSSGRNAIRFFDSLMERDLLERVSVERDLEYAIENGQFELHYQPQVEESGRVKGAEALLRWPHPERGFIRPDLFIPLAEESGQIKKLGRWVVRTALSDLKEKINQVVDGSFAISINISAVQIYDPEFQQHFMEDVQASGVDPANIMVELTESALVRSEVDIADRMHALKSTGVQFSLDDFGTGYSSLTRLKQLPINELKIDQSFVSDITTNTDSQAIARSVIALADTMGISVIAEGVETEEHQAILKEMGCNRYQGFYFGRPVNVESFIEFLHQQNAAIRDRH